MIYSVKALKQNKQAEYQERNHHRDDVSNQDSDSDGLKKRYLQNNDSALHSPTQSDMEREMVIRVIELLTAKGMLSEAEGTKAKYLAANDGKWRV